LESIDIAKNMTTINGENSMSGLDINGESTGGLTPEQEAALISVEEKTQFQSVSFLPDSTNFDGVLTVNGQLVQSGQPFDQSLNTTDNVEFASLSVPLINDLQSLTIDNQIILKDGVAGNEMALTAPASGIHTIQTFQSGAPANDLTITSGNVRMEANGNYTEQVSGSSIENIAVDKTLQVVGTNLVNAANNIFNGPIQSQAITATSLTTDNINSTNQTQTISANKVETIGANHTITTLANKIENIGAANQQTIIGTNTITAAAHSLVGDTTIDGFLNVGAGPGYRITDSAGQGSTNITTASQLFLTTGSDYDIQCIKPNGNPSLRSTKINMTVQTVGNVPVTPSFEIDGANSQITSRLPFRVDNEINAKHVKISTVSTLGDPNVIESVEGDQVTSAPIEIKGRDLKFTTTAANSQLDLDGEIIKIGTGSGNVINPPGQIAIGISAGDKGLDRSICIGEGSGNLSAGEDSIAIGSAANTAIGGVAIGGSASGAVDSLALGYRARTLVNNSIVLNGSGNFLNSANSGFYVKPIRSEFLNPNVCYDAGTGELVYNEKRALLLPDTDLTGVVRNDLSGILYKKTNDDGLWWAPDQSGTEIDLTAQTGGAGGEVTWLNSSKNVSQSIVTNVKEPVTWDSTQTDGIVIDNTTGFFLTADKTYQIIFNPQVTNLSSTTSFVRWAVRNKASGIQLGNVVSTSYSSGTTLNTYSPVFVMTVKVLVSGFYEVYNITGSTDGDSFNLLGSSLVGGTRTSLSIIELGSGGNSGIDQPNQSITWSLQGILNEYDTLTTRTTIPLISVVDGSASTNFPGAGVLQELNPSVRTGNILTVPTTAWYSIRFTYSHPDLPILGGNAQAGLGADCKIFIKINAGETIPLGQEDSGTGITESICASVDKYLAAGSTIEFGWEFGAAQTNEDFFINASIVNMTKTITLSNFTGSTLTAGGTQGLVPAPGTGDIYALLSGDGTWSDPSAPSIIDLYGRVKMDWTGRITPSLLGLNFAGSTSYQTLQNNYFLNIVNAGSQTGYINFDAGQAYDKFKFEVHYKILNTTTPADILGFFACGTQVNSGTINSTGGLTFDTDYFNGGSYNSQSRITDGAGGIITPYELRGYSDITGTTYFKMTMTRFGRNVTIDLEGTGGKYSITKSNFIQTFTGTRFGVFATTGANSMNIEINSIKLIAF